MAGSLPVVWVRIPPRPPMRSRYIQLGQLAYDTALRGSNLRNFMVGAAAIRADGALVSACNGPSTQPHPEAHAEARLCQKLDRGAIVHVVRRRRNGTLACSRPCPKCEHVLRRHGAAHVYYTDEVGDVRRLW